MEIDLNYIDLTPNNILLFGWNSEEPLIVTLSGNEIKLLNYDDDAGALDFDLMWSKGMLEFHVSIGLSFSNKKL